MRNPSLGTRENCPNFKGVKVARPRKPTIQLKATGQFRQDRHAGREHEPKPGGEPIPPDRLSLEAKQFWDKIVPDLISCGIATRLDSELLAQLCEWQATYCEILSSDGDQYRKVILLSCAAKSFNAIASKFGLTPVDRAKLSVAAPRKLDPIDEFLKLRLEKQNEDRH